MKWLWLLYIFACNAWSWQTYLWGKAPEDKERLLENGWGWFDPALDAHWTALKEGGERGRFHYAKDLAAEWAGNARQRGPKSLCWLASVLFIAGLLIGLVVGWVL